MKWTQGDGGSRKLATTHRWMTWSAVPARHKGLTVEKKWWKGPECNDGIWNWGLKQQLRLERRNFMRPSDKPSGWGLWSTPSGLPCGFEKLVLRHYGGVGPYPNRRRECIQLKSKRCTSTGHSWKFCPNRLKKMVVVVHLDRLAS
jgi:hypothetical protein